MHVVKAGSGIVGGGVEELPCKGQILSLNSIVPLPTRFHVAAGAGEGAVASESAVSGGLKLNAFTSISTGRRPTEKFTLGHALGSGSCADRGPFSVRNIYHLC